MHRSFFLAAALALATVATAQISTNITASGRLQHVAAGACNAQATHQFQCGDMLFYSSTLTLESWLNQYVVVTGAPQVVAGCTVLNVDVTEVVVATARLATLSFSNYRIGTNVILTSTAPAGAVVVHLFSVAAGTLPVQQFGTLFMDPLYTEQWAFDLGLGFPFPRSVSIPNDPNLAGLVPNFQAVIVDTTTLTNSMLSNDACFVIRT